MRMKNRKDKRMIAQKWCTCVIHGVCLSCVLVNLSMAKGFVRAKGFTCTKLFTDKGRCMFTCLKHLSSSSSKKRFDITSSSTQEVDNNDDDDDKKLLK